MEVAGGPLCLEARLSRLWPRVSGLWGVCIDWGLTRLVEDIHPTTTSSREQEEGRPSILLSPSSPACSTSSPRPSSPSPTSPHERVSIFFYNMHTLNCYTLSPFSILKFKKSGVLFALLLLLDFAFFFS